MDETRDAWALTRCRGRDGRVVGTLRLTPASEGSPIFTLAAAEARRLKLPPVQLRENGRYWCELTESRDDHARLACSLIRTTSPNPRLVLIETGAHVGLLRIDILSAHAEPIGSAYVDVQAVKLGERTHYRAMLDDIAARLMPLLYDARSSSQMTLKAWWRGRDEPQFLQRQIDFLIETLADPVFRGAIWRILERPHRRLRIDTQEQPIGKPSKLGRSRLKEIISASQRLSLPAAHPLAARLPAPTPTLPAHLSVSRKVDDFDTPENRFVKFVLVTFQDFLRSASGALGRRGADWAFVAVRADQAGRDVESLLSSPLFTQVSHLETLPASSVVLQHLSGYRDVLSAWLRFQTSARLSWETADDPYHAGKRDTAKLYEYWLFFQLADWFVARFDGSGAGVRASVHTSRDGLLAGLKHGQVIQSRPAQTQPGTAHQADLQRLRAQFSYNRAFDASCNATQAGSWTRRMQPDFTLTLWPASSTLNEAEARGQAVHLHLDAKYRVEHLGEVLDGDASPGQAASAQEARTTDLLKMHAYRDAIRRSAGAYVLYPGNAADRAAQWQVGEHPREHANVMFASDDLLPSLGAFAIVPVEGGRAEGMGQLVSFLDAVVAYVATQLKEADEP